MSNVVNFPGGGKPTRERERVFVFRCVEDDVTIRPRLMAVPESKIVSIESQWGSQNCYLVINGTRVEGSFDEFVMWFGERVNVE